MLIHCGTASVEDLLEDGPLALDLVEVQPVRWELESLLGEQLLARFASVQHGLPLGYYSLHLLDLGDELGDVVRLFERKRLQLPTPCLDLFFESLHLLRKGYPKLVQNLLMDLVVLVVHLALHCSIAYH